MVAMVFVLALQRCSAHPFTSVDEINQGMSFQYEQALYRLMLRSAADTTAERQTFYISPTLKATLLPRSSVNLPRFSASAACGSYSDWWKGGRTQREMTQGHYERLSRRSARNLRVLSVFYGAGVETWPNPTD